MAVRIRLKRMGRRHRPFFRVCAMDARTPRDGRVIEELGYYDPMVKEVDARAVLKGERIDYWLGVGAQPTPKVQVLIKKYGTNGTHLEQQREALERVKQKPAAPPPKVLAPVESSADAADEAESPAAEEAEAKAEESVAEEDAAASETTAEANEAAESASSETGEAESAETAAAAEGGNASEAAESTPEESTPEKEAESS